VLTVNSENNHKQMCQESIRLNREESNSDERSFSGVHVSGTGQGGIGVT
jgi:hypothetical protein